MTETSTEIEYPSDDDLWFWWRCYRKIGFASREQAEAVLREYPDKGLQPYRCPTGDHWHNGKPITRGTARNKTGPSMLRKSWRKQLKKPSIEELHAARLSGAWHDGEYGCIR